MTPRKIAPAVKHLQTKFVFSRTRALLSHPLFWFLTVVGNGAMVIGAWAFYWIEAGTNPKLLGFIDALWWSVATVTTVGYGDISPITTPGRLAGMALMIFGSALFGAFTALFAAILLEPEIAEVGEELRELERRGG